MIVRAKRIWRLKPSDALENSSNWNLIAREEALRLRRVGPVAVVYPVMGTYRAAWLDESPLLFGGAPEVLRARYYFYRGKGLPWQDVTGMAPRAVEEAPPAIGETSVEPVHWVEVQLVYEGGRPVAREKYKIELPDGSVHEGELDGEGRVRFDEIIAGACKISFLELDSSIERSA